MKKITTMASLFLLAASGPALAQTPSPDPSSPTVNPPSVTAPSTTEQKVMPRTTNTTDAVKSQTGQWRASTLIGASVRNTANETIGEINDVLIGPGGKIASVIVGAGGFLGLGEKNVALDFSELQISRDNKNNVVILSKSTKEALQAAPEWKDPMGL